MNAPWLFDRPVLAGTAAAAALLANRFEPDREDLFVAHLDSQARCIELSRFAGDAQEARMPVREILADALRLGSAGVVLAHNHPSGDPTPSESDLRSTRRLAGAAEAIDLTILDHLVFAGSDYRSFRRMGLL